MELDLLDPANFVHGQPYDYFRYLRENDPIHWHDEPNGPGFYVLTRYADIRAFEADSDTFRNYPTPLIADSTAYGDEYHAHILFEDPPHHTEHRRLIRPELSVNAVRSRQHSLEELCNDIIDRVIEKGECDLVEDLAGRMASFVMADLIGLPREQSLVMFEAAAIIASGTDPSYGIGLEAKEEMARWATATFKDRREAPRDDMLSRIANTPELRGVPYDELHFYFDFHLLVGAGSDTSRNALATGINRLFENPEAHRDLVADPSLVPGAVEEILRYDPPIVFQRRTASRDIEFNGILIKEGQKVVGYYGAANRDPEVFHDPDTFDIRRSPNPHLAFGTGRHTCLGNHLARLELVAMLTAIVERMPDLHPAGEQVWEPHPQTPAVIGPTKIPVAFSPGVRVGDAVLA